MSFIVPDPTCRTPGPLDDELVCQMFHEGMSAETIARRLNFDPIWVTQCLDGVERHIERTSHLTKEDKSWIIDLRNTGIQLSEICEITGFSIHQVKKTLWRAGVYTPSRRPVTPEELKQFQRLYDSGMPLAHIAKKMNRPISTISWHVVRKHPKK